MCFCFIGHAYNIVLSLFFLRNDTNTLVLPDLGKLRQVRILHDNSGSTPSWFLEKVGDFYPCMELTIYSRGHFSEGAESCAEKSNACPPSIANSENSRGDNPHKI